MNPSTEAAAPRTLIRAAGLLLALILAAAGIAAYVNHLHRLELREQGVRIQALVTEVTRLGGKNKLTYEFQVNGVLYHVMRRSQLDFKPGDPIQIIYLPESPEVNDLASALEQH